MDAFQRVFNYFPPFWKLDTAYNEFGYYEHQALKLIFFFSEDSFWLTSIFRKVLVQRAPLKKNFSNTRTDKRGGGQESMNLTLK